MSAISSTENYIRSELAKRFPLDAYPQAKKAYRHFVLHILIAGAQPDKAILDWLAVCNKKYASYINASDTMVVNTFVGTQSSVKQPTHLTPLSVAVLMRRGAIVRALCTSKEIDLVAKDRKGWTPLQHAIAMNDLRILDRIESALNATLEKTAKKAEEWFPFLRSMAKPKLPKADEIIGSYKDHQGTLKPLVQREFQEMSGGALFYDGIIASPNALFYNWSQQSEWTREIFFDEHIKNKPNLLLNWKEKVGFGVVADQFLKKGDFLSLYGSELVSPDKVKAAAHSPYTHKNTDSALFRNWGSLANDGFPNVGMFPILIEGVELYGLISFRDIEPGEELVHNYGFGHPVKWGPRCELSREKILEVYPTSQSLLDEMAKSCQSKKELDEANQKLGEDKLADMRVQLASQVQGLAYLIHTPSMLLSLLIQSRFELAAVQKIFQDEMACFLVRLCTDKGKKLKTIYAKMFQLIRLFHGSVKNEEIRKCVAKKFEGNMRASGAALAMMLKRKGDWNQKEFDRLAEAAEDIYSFLEARSPNLNETRKKIAALSPEERNGFLDLIENHTGFIFIVSHEHYQKAFSEIESL